MSRRRFLQILAGFGAFLTGLFRSNAALAYDGTISGNFAGTVPNGQHWHITGNVNLTGDLVVEGLLTGINTFTVTGNGFQILVQNGGVVQLTGQPKTGWVRWGQAVTGWQSGDRLVVAPTKAAIYTPTVITWGGSWAATSRPPNSPDVTLVNGSVALPEVANIDRSIKFNGLRRFHLHNGAGIQSLKYLAIVNSGLTGVLGDYPLHFHLNGDTSRGSAVEGVVVEGGKNHAFVPHGSHGITFKDCVAYNTAGPAYWWDPPLNNNQPDPNESHDIFYDHCLAVLVTGTDNRLDGFTLGRGVGNRCVDTASTAVQGGTQASGFEWPEMGTGVWEFRDCVAHNNKALGIFGWQNTSFDHVIEDFTAYRNGRAGILHGAYLNFYLYRNIVLTGNVQWAFMGHALSSNLPSMPDKNLIIEDLISDGPLLIASHQQTSLRPVFYRRCTFTGVTYNEVNVNQSSVISYEDCGLVPANFILTIIQPQSIIEIKEGGLLTHRWASGVWS